MAWLLLRGKLNPHQLLSILLTDYSILCSDFAIKRIDEPFVLPTDDMNEWAL